MRHSPQHVTMRVGSLTWVVVPWWRSPTCEP